MRTSCWIPGRKMSRLITEIGAFHYFSNNHDLLALLQAREERIAARVHRILSSGCIPVTFLEWKFHRNLLLL